MPKGLAKAVVLAVYFAGMMYGAMRVFLWAGLGASSWLLTFGVVAAMGLAVYVWRASGYDELPPEPKMGDENSN